MQYYLKVFVVLVIGFSLLLNSSIIKAQDNIKKPIFSMGIKAGPVISGITMKNSDIKSGLNYAIILSNEIYMSDSLSLEIGIGNHNTKFSSSGFDYRISYFTIPILLKYYFTSHTSNYGIWFGIGFEPRYKSFAKNISSFTNVSSATEGGLLAIGGKYNTSDRVSILFDLRFYIGLSKAINNDFTNNKGHLREFIFYTGAAYTIF